MIGALAGYLGSLGHAGRWISGIAAAALVLMLAPAAAFANDPTTHQYASQLTQVCVGGEVVTVETGDGAGADAGTGSAEACGETAAGGGGGVAGGEGGGTAGGTADSGTVGSLPFTGLDLIMLAAVAGALLTAGLLLRRRRPEPTEVRG